MKDKLPSTPENRISGLEGACLAAHLGQVNHLARDHSWEDRLTLCQRVRRSNFSFNEITYFFHGISPQHSSLQSTHFLSLFTFLNYSRKGYLPFSFLALLSMLSLSGHICPPCWLKWHDLLFFIRL